MAERADILLIGGTGFIGSELARVFTQMGKEVVSVGRHVKDHHPGRIITIDVFDQEALERLLPETHSVFILTGQNHKDFDASKELVALQNIITVINKHSPRKVFYCSSALVYGERIEPAEENDSCIPIESYSQFKQQAERLLEKKLNPKIHLGILRLGNVYGNPANRGFIHWLIQSMKNKQGIILNGEGTQERDYVFVDDVVDALVQLETKLDHSDTINLVSGKSISLKGVVKIMEELTGFKIPFAINHQVMKEVQKSRLSAKKLNEYYSIRFSHDLHSGLDITWQRYSMTV